MTNVKLVMASYINNLVLDGSWHTLCSHELELIQTPCPILLSFETRQKCGFHSNTLVEPCLAVTKQYTKQQVAEDAVNVDVSLFGENKRQSSWFM